MRLALDADVLIGALEGAKAHHRQAQRLFLAWRELGADTLMSVVNLSEIPIAPASDRERLRTAREAIATLGVRIHTPNEAIGVDAARLRARHPISLPDGYLLATAKHLRAEVVSFDRKVSRAAEAEGIATR